MESTGAFVPPTKQAVLAALHPPLGQKDAPTAAVFAALENMPCYCPLAAPKQGEWLRDHKEVPQTFAKYVAGKNTAKVSSNKNKIYIMPLESSVTDPFLELLCKFSNIFYPGVQATLMKGLNLDDPAICSKISSRVNEWTQNKQYLTKDILNTMAPLLPKDGLNLMGCLNTDLYPNDSWNYVFGWGRSDIKCGVFSFARFSETFFDPDKKEDPQLLEYKAVRIMVHEMGHTFNIGHCTFHNCGMNGMNHGDELMSKPMEFCPVCLKKLQYCLQFDPVERFQGLKKFCEESKNPHIFKMAAFYENALKTIASSTKPATKSTAIASSSSNQPAKLGTTNLLAQTPKTLAPKPVGASSSTVKPTVARK